MTPSFYLLGDPLKQMLEYAERAQDTFAVPPAQPDTSGLCETKHGAQ